MSAIISRDRYAREVLQIARKAQAKAGLPAHDQTTLLLALGVFRAPESAAGFPVADLLAAMAQKKSPGL